VHGFLSGDFNKELSGGMVHITSECSMGISLLPLSDENDRTDLIGSDTFSIEGQFGHEDLIVGGHGDFS